MYSATAQVLSPSTRLRHTGAEFRQTLRRQRSRRWVLHCHQPEQSLTIQQAHGLQALALMEVAHAERAEMEKQRQLKRPRTGAGTAGDPIEIDSGTPSRPPSAPPLKRSRSNGAGFKGCYLCMQSDSHPLAACPVVKAGPEAIKSRVSPSHSPRLCSPCGRVLLPPRALSKRSWEREGSGDSSRRSRRITMG